MHPSHKKKERKAPVPETTAATRTSYQARLLALYHYDYCHHYCLSLSIATMITYYFNSCSRWSSGSTRFLPLHLFCLFLHFFLLSMFRMFLFLFFLLLRFFFLLLSVILLLLPLIVFLLKATWECWKTCSSQQRWQVPVYPRPSQRQHSFGLACHPI